MKKVLVVTAALALLVLGITAQADVFNLGAGLTNLETVTVGDAGNAADTSGPGAVAYIYNIGKYEVTAGQYTDFLNAKAKTDPYGLYDLRMWSQVEGCKIQRTSSGGQFIYSVASDFANRPVNYVSFWDSCRFANWLNNGQGSGDTETGAYTLTASGIADNTVARNPDAKWAVTSLNEWYKAAFYKGGSASAGYWKYATRSDTKPGWDMADISGNNANYYYPGAIGSPYFRTEVGEFQNSDSPYGTFDQAGNVWEWYDNTLSGGSLSRLSGGGCWAHNYVSSGERIYKTAANGDQATGFRVSQVPEPSSFIALGALVAPLLAFRRRRGK